MVFLISQMFAALLGVFLAFCVVLAVKRLMDWRERRRRAFLHAQKEREQMAEDSITDFMLTVDIMADGRHWIDHLYDSLNAQREEEQ